MTHTVMVWGKPYKIDVEQKSKRVWIASGECMGQSIQAKDFSEGAAIKRWREAAEYKGR